MRVTAADQVSKTLSFCAARQLFVCILMFFCCVISSSEAHRWKSKKHPGINHRVVIVDPSGHENFTKIQSAIDSVPPNNDRWFFIYVEAGVYREKIKIEKPYIVLVGAGKRMTRVEWDDHYSVAQSPTFTSLADYTVVKSMTFANTYNLPSNKGKNKNPRVPAVAAMIAGDRSAFYKVGFAGVQDTLWDCEGRHYFYKCTIQGAVDFIFGSGQSIYERTVIQVLGGAIEPGLVGYITAQGRTNPYDANGFVFKNCLVHGAGRAFLGRPWRGYARVVFFHSNLTNVVVPLGWDAWNFVGRENQLTYAEYGCVGSGSDTSRRVEWMKRLSQTAVQSMADLNFINSDGWLGGVPLAFI